ncbi:MAG: right-handed parallel beta-helix repeat-containing protein [Sphingomonadaceae bacterium]
MAFIRSLAASGLILVAATPASAFGFPDLSHLMVTVRSGFASVFSTEEAIEPAVPTAAVSPVSAGSVPKAVATPVRIALAPAPAAVPQPAAPVAVAPEVSNLPAWVDVLDPVVETARTVASTASSLVTTASAAVTASVATISFQPAPAAAAAPAPVAPVSPAPSPLASITSAIGSTIAWIGNAIEQALTRINLSAFGFEAEPVILEPAVARVSSPTLVSAPTVSTMPAPEVKVATFAELTPVAVAPAPQPSQQPAPAPTTVTAPPAVEESMGAPGRVFFVDFANGNNGNSGTSSSSPWKHAPGDPAATGGPATVRLQPGDVIRFRGGVAYRGTINVRTSGQAGAPITYSGTGFGTGNAIIDGADPVTSAVPCPGAVACGGASNWQSLWLVTYTEPTIAQKKLYDGRGPLAEAQTPAPADTFKPDMIADYERIPQAQATALTQGRIDNARLADAARGQPNARLLVWVQPNEIRETAILSVSGNTILFDTTGLSFYTTRDSYAAIIGSVRGVTRAGTYARIGTGRAIVFPRPGETSFSIGSGRRGIVLAGVGHVAIRGFHFRHGTASPTANRSEGIAILDINKGTNNVLIEGNRFGPSSMRNGDGAISFVNAQGVTIRNNRFTDLEWGSGIRTGATVQSLLIEGNRLVRGGRTGIAILSSKDVTIRNNLLAGWYSVHGNALSVYSSSARVLVTGNCIHDSIRPVTISGSTSSVEDNNYRFTGNIFVGLASTDAAIQSWANVRGVEISNNVLLTGRRGAILSPRDLRVSATNNRVTSGIVVSSGAIPSDWTIRDNDATAVFETAVAEATLSTERCSARGRAGLITVAPPA